MVCSNQRVYVATQIEILMINILLECLTVIRVFQYFEPFSYVDS